MKARGEHRLGLAYAAEAAGLWGIGGVAAQELFRRHGVDPQWLVCVRMTGPGVLLLAVLRPAWPGRLLGRLLVVSLVGVLVFSFSLAGLRPISPTESAVTSTLEPAVAGAAGAVLLG